MMRSLWCAVALVTALLTSSSSAQLGSMGAGAAGVTPRGSGQAGTIRYRIIDGALAKKIDQFCAGLWMDTEEVLLIEYRARTYLLRTSGGNVGLACKVP
jgi:hypothetical protein